MKSFRDQMKECKNNGNLIDVDISVYDIFSKIALVCLKNKEVCHSKLCLEERKIQPK